IRIPDLSLAHILRNLDALGSQIGAHPLRRIRVEGDVVQVTVFLRWLRKQFQILVFINLDEGDAVSTIVALQTVRFRIAEKALIESPSLSQVADKKGHVRNTENVWASYLVIPGALRAQKQAC